MDLHCGALTMGVYAGLVTLGVLRGTVRLTLQPLYDLAKLTLLTTLLTSLLCCPDLLVVGLVGVASLCFYSLLPSPFLPGLANKAIFITGCDRGLGHQLAIHLDSLGVTVFAGCLFPGQEGETMLKESCSSRLTTVPVDVSDQTSVKAAAESVKKHLNGKDLWGVVNNAGIMQIGSLEVMTLEDVRRVVDVNFMGQVYVCRSFLPLLRRSRGRLVNVASNTGIAPVPFHTAYSSSKAAVACMTECLRLELAPFGIHCATIIPSGYRTGIHGNNTQSTGDRWWSQADTEVQQSYGQSGFYPVNIHENYKTMLNPDFSGIVHKMTEALLERHPKDFYYKGFLACILPFLYLHTPSPLARLFYSKLTTWYKFDPPGAKTTRANANQGAEE